MEMTSPKRVTFSPTNQVPPPHLQVLLYDVETVGIITDKHTRENYTPEFLQRHPRGICSAGRFRVIKSVVEMKTGI